MSRMGSGAMRVWAVWTVALAVCLLAPAKAGAHAFEPAVLQLEEDGEQRGRFRVTWKASTRAAEGRRSPAEALQPRFGVACEEATPRRVERWEGREVSRWTIACDGAEEEGLRVAIEGLAESANDVLLRVARADGAVKSALLNRAEPSLSVADGGSEGGRWSVAATYLVLGVEHIVLGFDHLLFVLGLVLLVRSRRQLVGTITAFTAAHSITLGMATLDVVGLGQMAVEAVIAASLLLLAVEVVRAERGVEGLAARAPWGVAFGFGLVHGFGFAGALREIGLPAGERWLALGMFNVGVELGQLAVVAVWVVGALGVARVGWPVEGWRRWAAYLIGVPACYWLVDRVVALVGL